MFLGIHMNSRIRKFITAGFLSCCLTQFSALATEKAPRKGERVVLLGSGFIEREQNYGHFETVLHQRFPEHDLVVRNMGNQGDTPAFRPRPGRESQWAFPGAEVFRPKLSMHLGIGHYASPDEWLTLLRADTIVAFFGYSESFDGRAGLANFKAEMDAFVRHTLAQRYNGATAPKLILASPAAFEDRSHEMDLPNGRTENANLALYAEAISQVAADHQLTYVDLFGITKRLLKEYDEPLTINGCHYSDFGYSKIAPHWLNAIYGEDTLASKSSVAYETARSAVLEKSWFWFNDYRMLNGVHVHGRRYKPFGNENYPEEIEKMRQMTELRDRKIWEVVRGETSNLLVDDSGTRALTPIETNFKRSITYLDGPEAVETLHLPDGYQASLFAAESDFPDLRNPVQMAFDNEGGLWVSVLHSYPHYMPGGPRPNDKLIVFEDTDGDGRADQQTVFAEGLHLPIGFEIAHNGVYVSEEPNLLFLQDTDGDGRADSREIILGGFDSHDTHHAISAYCADGSGAFYMCEGRFLHSQVETPYGTVRCNDGGVWRFDPNNWRLERHSQSDYSNPWGIAFDEWGQNYVSDASGGANYWLLPVSAKVPYGIEIGKEGQFTTHRVRPTSGSEFVSSRHFPDEVQGDFLINNTIGFLGTKQHTMVEDGAGFTGELRYDLLRSDDPNFRPVDLEFAPDGSLYIVDWHNALIGHMQHSARDPNRDVDHGRIYRITYPARPLVKPAVVAGAPVGVLLENLKLHEYRSRYRTRRELRGRKPEQVLPLLKKWVAQLDTQDEKYERHLLEALWVTWGYNQVDPELLERCLNGESHQLRAGAARVLRHSYYHFSQSPEWFLQAAQDPHPRVRLEAIVAASWLDNEVGARIAIEALKHPVEKWMKHAFHATMLTLKDDVKTAVSTGRLDVSGNSQAEMYLAGKLDLRPQEKAANIPVTNVPNSVMASFKLGQEVYRRDAHCITCHQQKGNGLPNIYPSLIKNDWVEGDPERLIKVVLKGLWGPLTVNGDSFNPATGTPPMTGFAPLLNDEEVAGVLNYVRFSWKNSGSPITPEMVAEVRKKTEDRRTFYMVDEILKEHPIEGGAR